MASATTTLFGDAASAAAQPTKRKQLGNLSHASEINSMSAVSVIFVHLLDKHSFGQFHPQQFSDMNCKQPS
jgi:hypothetical protein